MDFKSAQVIVDLLSSFSYAPEFDLNSNEGR